MDREIMRTGSMLNDVAPSYAHGVCLSVCARARACRVRACVRALWAPTFSRTFSASTAQSANDSAMVVGWMPCGHINTQAAEYA
jgi:hypothetical protein